MKAKPRKVVIIGAGSVGTAYIYALLQTGLASEIALIDIDEKAVAGEVMDLSHGLPFIPPVSIHAGDYSDCRNAHLIVVTAGAKQKPGQSRTDLVRNNASIIRSICESIKEHSTDAVLVMVTNPVDILTHIALHNLGWPRQRVIGSGTVLDTARLKYMLSRHCGIDARNVHAYVLGEHGDSEMVAWSMAHIAGVQIERYCQLCQGCDAQQQHKRIAEQVRNSAYHIIDYKGSTYYGIGMSLVRISQAILRDEHSVLTVSVELEGEYNLSGLCLSVPCVVAENGVERIIDTELSAAENKGLKKSAEILQKLLEDVSD
ncbi:MAG: L-lactate dehydrogenase [Sedimentisphaerales bacterium]|nr:L-lactate dehydrogenase [Sedimentisphaerales bacterium]